MSHLSATDTRLAAYVPELLRRWGGEPGFESSDGTMVFADVSGFTRLTEKLTRRGKVGAEEMVTAISAVWEALLGVVENGDVLKFAGDALVIFFRGTDHAVRACHAALVMQRRLPTVGRIDSGSGVVRLRMSVGVHSGRFHTFVVGGEHLDLLVLGPSATTTLEMESAAGPGQVVVSNDVITRCEGIRLSHRIEGGAVLRSVRSPLPPPPAAVEDPAPLDRYISPLLRERLGRIEHEHRRAAIAFAQIGGIDTMLREEGTKATFARLQGFVLATMEILDEYGVLLTSSDLGTDGAVFMMSAGVPDSSGDDDARILRVARRLVELDHGIPVRVGVNAGNVFVGDVGPSFRRSYVTMGDTTNLAARMMSEAPWGGVLVAAAALEPVASRFIWREVEPLQVKGKRSPVEAAIVDGIRAWTPAPVGSGPLVGREEELATLLSELTLARSGDGRVVEMVGAEGTGKSRLIAELRRHADGVAWITTTCDPFEHASPYHSARSLLRQILSIPATADPTEAGAALSQIVEGHAPHLFPWLPLLAVPVDAQVDETGAASEVTEKFRRVRTQQVVAELIESLPVAPAVAVIEDASHMDDASAELIAELVGRLGERPWLVVITRLEDVSGLHAGRGFPALTLKIEPLSPAESTELAMRLAEISPVPSHHLPQLVSRADGNPLFLAELVARAVDGTEEMPHSVEAIVAARIDALAPKDRRTLRYLSVLGERFDDSTVDEALADLAISSTDAALWRRLEGFVLKEGDQFTFTNPLVRQVAYEGLTYDWRRRLHSRLADFASERRSDQLPLHLIRAERWEEAWTAARDAGERARRAGANAVAGELYDMGLVAADHVEIPPQELTEVASLAGEVWARVGVPDRALEALSMALAHVDDEVERVLLAGRRAAVHENAGRFPQALGMYTRAIADARDLTSAPARDRCLGVLLAGYASTRHRQGRHEEAAQHAEEAAASAEAASDRATLAYVYHLLDRIHTDSGDRETALHYRDAALPIFAEVGDLASQGTVLHDLAAEAQRGGRLEEAAWLYARAIEARTRAGDVVRAAASINAVGEVEMALGLAETAHSRFTAALRTWRGARSPEGIAVASHNLGLLAAERGDAPAAIDHFDESRLAAESIGAETLLPRVFLGLATALRAVGRWVEAWDSAGRVLASDGIDEQSAVTAHRIRADALEATGGTGRAKEELARALTLADTSGLDEDSAAIRTALAAG